MGQTIEINGTNVVDHVLIIDTDRSLAGQVGESFSGVEAARAQSTFPARLAVRLFEADPSVDHVFVMSNTVSVRRPQDWNDGAVILASSVVSEFFRFYS
ncbi:MAG: hypothetical protein OEX04_01405 [Acidimicrobiia bacterium]|nr:hypothetical protein [Acidimicrobiia bacterium]MDH4306110.1 hypothetical protein [Acidimicrobiia bacterium]MDH5292570.1 hypothetical protein [Acidimicrobiia bacterium]